MGDEEDAARPRSSVANRLGKLRDVKRPACCSVADRRVSKLRDGWGQPCRRHVESAGAKDALRPTCSGRNARRSPSQVSNGRSDQLQPQNQVSSGRSDQLQPQDQCPTGEGPTSNFNRRTEPRTKDQGQLRRFGPSCLRRTNVKLRSGSIPSWETLWSTRATGITHPGFYGWKPWKKPNNASIITAPGTRCEDFRRPTAQIVLFGYRKHQEKFT